MRVERRSLYDFPRIYELVYGVATTAEFSFLRQAFAKHAERTVRRVFEPACGTGRLLARFAQAAFTTFGMDLNPNAVAHAHARLKRHGERAQAIVGDMTQFAVERPFDAAFNAINSFRHLPTERATRSHLRCMARSIAPGGVYVLCFTLTPTATRPTREERWSAQRGFLSVQATVRSLRRDPRTRQELFRVTVEAQTPTDTFRIVNETTFRTHTAEQFRVTLAAVPEWELVATHDFAYDIRRSVSLDATTEDVVVVLRRRG